VCLFQAWRRKPGDYPKKGGGLSGGRVKGKNTLKNPEHEGEAAKKERDNGWSVSGEGRETTFCQRFGASSWSGRIDWGETTGVRDLICRGFLFRRLKRDGKEGPKGASHLKTTAGHKGSFRRNVSKKRRGKGVPLKDDEGRSGFLRCAERGKRRNDRGEKKTMGVEKKESARDEEGQPGGKGKFFSTLVGKTGERSRRERHAVCSHKGM